MGDQRLLKTIRNRLSPSIIANHKKNDAEEIMDNYWTKVKSHKITEELIPMHIKHNGSIISGPKKVADTFNKFFIDKQQT